MCVLRWWGVCVNDRVSELLAVIWRPLTMITATIHRASLWKTRLADVTVRDRYVNEWEGLVKHTEWQIAPRTPLTAQFRGEWGIICIQIVSLYESMMDDSNRLHHCFHVFLFEGHSLRGVAWQKNIKGMADWCLWGRNYSRCWDTVLWVGLRSHFLDKKCFILTRLSSLLRSSNSPTFLHWTNQKFLWGSINDSNRTSKAAPPLISSVFVQVTRLSPQIAWSRQMWRSKISSVGTYRLLVLGRLLSSYLVTGWCQRATMTHQAKPPC